jgi:hypothetical protein
MAERDISALALGGGIRSGARGQRLHELVMKLPGLRDQCLILLGVVAEHFGDRGRHLVLAAAATCVVGPAAAAALTADPILVRSCDAAAKASGDATT